MTFCAPGVGGGMAMAVWPLWSGSGRVSHSRIESRILKWLWLLVMVWVITCTAAAAVARAGGSGDVSGGSAGYLSASRPEPRTQHADINRDTVPTSNRENYGNKDGDGAELFENFRDDFINSFEGDNRSSTLFSQPTQKDQTSTKNCTYSDEGKDFPTEVHLASLRWHEIGRYFVLTAFLIFAGLGKLAFHHLEWLSSKVPESCLLVILGLIVGLLVHLPEITESCKASHVEFPVFSSRTFFMILLPPIILEAAYCLHDRSFSDNLGSVLIFAVIGTLLNIFIIGLSLFGLAQAGVMGDFNVTVTELLVFSSLISAVDPVAVLNIFQDLGVNKNLYFLVFGESLLNDGVTVVVYNTFSVFIELPSLTSNDYVLSVLSFFVVVICGAAIGLIYGILTALFTRITTTMRVMEPLAMLAMAYLAYVTAELFHFSGIISLVACGVMQSHYAFHNISSKSYTCIKYFTKMVSAISETVIFMFLGMLLVSSEHAWNTGFVLWTLFLCFVVRFLVTFSLSRLINCRRLHNISISEQLIMGYGGLRGAVAFALVSMLPDEMPLKEHFITATLAVILFTVFVQGITIRPLVNWLHIPKRKFGLHEIFEEVNESLVEHMMAGIEDVLGQHGDYYLQRRLQLYAEIYLKRWFTRSSSKAPLKRFFERIDISNHYANLYGPAVLLHQQREYLKEKLSLNRENLLQNSSDDGSMLAAVQCNTTDRSTRLWLTLSSSAEEDIKVLRRAIRSNPYNKLHYTFNRNLVNDDNQELRQHLHRRHARARRLAQCVSSQISLKDRSQLRQPPNASITEAPPLNTMPIGNGSILEWDGEATNEINSPLSLISLDIQKDSNNIKFTQVSTDDIAQLRLHRNPRTCDWNHPKLLHDIMHSLSRETEDHHDESRQDFPDASELLEDIRRVNVIIDCHRRHSAYRRSARQQRLHSTSGGSASERRLSF